MSLTFEKPCTKEGNILFIDDCVNYSTPLEVYTDGGVTVYRTGKNLFPIGTFDINRSKTIDLDFTLPANTPLVFSGIFNTTANNNTWALVQAKYTDDTYASGSTAIGFNIGITERQYKKMTFPKPVKSITFCASSNWADSEGFIAKYTEFQVELGTEATAYEPYQGAQAATADESGKVEGLTSLKPMTLFTDTGANMSVTYLIPNYSEDVLIYKQRMFDYYPQVIQSITEFKVIIDGESPEINELHAVAENIISNAYLTTMSEDRIVQWETMLGIKPIEGSSFEDRRDTVIARIRGQGKLNSELINIIVNTFTGGTANSWVKDGTLYVEITPPPNNKQYQFKNVEQELAKKIPAHLSLNVARNYFSWGEIKDKHPTWGDISSNFDSWSDVLLFVPF